MVFCRAAVSTSSRVMTPSARWLRTVARSTCSARARARAAGDTGGARIAAAGSAVAAPATRAGVAGPAGPSGGGAGACIAAGGGAALSVASSGVARRAMTVPTAICSPGVASNSSTVPSCQLSTSMAAFSVSTTAMIVPFVMACPGVMRHSEQLARLHVRAERRQRYVDHADGSTYEGTGRGDDVRRLRQCRLLQMGRIRHRHLGAADARDGASRS